MTHKMKKHMDCNMILYQDTATFHPWLRNNSDWTIAPPAVVFLRSRKRRLRDGPSTSR